MLLYHPAVIPPAACFPSNGRFDESKLVAVEHETNVDKKQTVAGTAKQELLFQQFPQAAPEGALIQAPITRHASAQFVFVIARTLPHLMINQFKNLHPPLGQVAGLLDAIQKEFYETAGVHFLLPPKALVYPRLYK